MPEWFYPAICDRTYLSTFLPSATRHHTARGNAI